jgi:hypothetical protein
VRALAERPASYLEHRAGDAQRALEAPSIKIGIAVCGALLDEVTGHIAPLAHIARRWRESRRRTRPKRQGVAR